MAGRGQRIAHSTWYEASVLSLLLLPLSWIYGIVVGIRRRLYQRGILTVEQVDVPVVVVGNISVGGTGKTPVVVSLVAALAKRGIRAGVASRGYGGEQTESARLVRPDDDARIVGDEPLLIAKRTGCPVAVCVDRVAAARLLQAEGVDVVLTDDGMQHYRLGRDVEIAVVDGRRGLGNRRLLPAGPLRERPSRLCGVDHVLVNGGAGDTGLPACTHSKTTTLSLRPDALVSIDGKNTQAPDAFDGKDVLAVAAIGNPERFFATLESLGMRVTGRGLRDHEAIDAKTLNTEDGRPVVITEKDAVKFQPGSMQNVWYLAVSAELQDDWVDRLVATLDTKRTEADAG